MLANIELCNKYVTWPNSKRFRWRLHTERAFPGIHARHDSERGKTSFVNEIFAQPFTMRYTKCSSMQAIERSQYLLKNKNIKCVHNFLLFPMHCSFISNNSHSLTIHFPIFYSFDRHIQQLEQIMCKNIVLASILEGKALLIQRSGSLHILLFLAVFVSLMP